LLIVILAAVVSGSAWLTREHRSDLADLEQHATTASLLQDARFDATLAVLLLERYVTTGNDAFIPVIRSLTAGATNSLAEALADEETRGDEREIATLIEVVAGATFLSETSEQVITLRQGGNLEETRAALKQVAPRIKGFGVEISEAAAVSPRSRSSDSVRYQTLWISLVLVLDIQYQRSALWSIPSLANFDEC